MLGPRISLSLPRTDEDKMTLSNGCNEHVSSKLTEGKLQVVTTTRCPPELKNLDAKTTESLLIKGKKIKYEHVSDKSKKVVCDFEVR